MAPQSRGASMVVTCEPRAKGDRPAASASELVAATGSKVKKTTTANQMAIIVIRLSVLVRWSAAGDNQDGSF